MQFVSRYPLPCGILNSPQLVSQSLPFPSTAIRSGYYKSLFASPDIISSLLQGVVVPNVALREHDVEQFEHDALEFIRLDLALSSTGTDLTTRRQAAADVLRLWWTVALRQRQQRSRETGLGMG